MVAHNSKFKLMAGGVVVLLGLAAAGSRAAHAELRVCNPTDSRIGVAIGYKTKEGWVSEGWWKIEPGKCNRVVKADLTARYYYVFAYDQVKGGKWGGTAILCTKKTVFTIKGTENCEERESNKTGFFEVDTGEKTDWEVKLSAPGAAQ